jgi:hypothetical protein
MFCPSCGVEERGRARFCRGCGAELQSVRLAVERPDAVTNAAVTARDEIGRVLAAKLKEIEGGKDFRRVVEDSLPVIQKFLESPEEKRLRQIGEGVTTASVGLGIALFGMVLSAVVHQAETAGLLVVGAAALVILIGIGIAVSGWLFTVPRKMVAPLERTVGDVQVNSGPVTSPSLDSKTVPPSITEGTTYELQPIDRAAGPK